MKKIFIPLILLMFAGCTESSTLYKDPSQPIEARVENLLKQMTLQEKLEQINMLVLGKNDNINNLEARGGRKFTPETGSFIYFDTSAVTANKLQHMAMEDSRLGIPVILGHDVIHGFRTLFPMPLAQACSWNTELSYKAARVAAKESYLSGVRWTFSPMIDVARDARWGRIAESYGEDPYTNAQFAMAVVKGYQGENLNDKYSIAACLKHFAGYAYSQSGRDYNPTNVSNLSLWETVLPPYKAAIESGAATIMSSFNDLNGVPTVANHYLLTDVLRGKLGFDGFVVSDWSAIQQLITQKFAADSLEAAVKSINAGNDMDMYDYLYRKYLQEAIDNGSVKISTIDEAVRRILRVKFRLGLFETPYVEVEPESQRYLQEESKELSKMLAQESMVLLKNNSVLPISPKVKRILLIGPMISDRENMMGTWQSHSQSSDVVTILDGLKAEFGNSVTFDFLDGVSFEENDKLFMSRMASRASAADMIIVALGEKKNWSGENGAKASLALPKSQEEVIIAAKKYNRPIVLLTSSGRPLVLTDIEPYADAIIQMWQPGLYGGSAVAEILSGKVNPSGRLAITFPYTTGQIPIFYNTRQNARQSIGGSQGAYADAPREPLYEFGYGLSYSSFNYNPIEVSSNSLQEDESITASVKVTNESEVDGEETLFWYIDDAFASITQPVKKLKFFEKRSVKAGETVEFKFKIDPMRDLSYLDPNGECCLERGDFYIIVKDQRVKITLK